MYMPPLALTLHAGLVYHFAEWLFSQHGVAAFSGHNSKGLESAMSELNQRASKHGQRTFPYGAVRELVCNGQL